MILVNVVKETVFYHESCNMSFLYMVSQHLKCDYKPQHLICGLEIEIYNNKDDYYCDGLFLLVPNLKPFKVKKAFWFLLSSLHSHKGRGTVKLVLHLEVLVGSCSNKCLNK